MVSQEHLQTEIREKFGVAVCGGGFGGISAALSEDFSALKVKELQEILRADGVVLHEKEIF